MDADLSYNFPFSCTDRKAITHAIHRYLLHIMEQYGAGKMIPQQHDDTLLAKGLSQSSVRYAQRIMSVAFEVASKYHYIETNPARDILTKFGKTGKTPDPYTVQQMQQLMGPVVGTE